MHECSYWDDRLWLPVLYTSEYSSCNDYQQLHSFIGLHVEVCYVYMGDKIPIVT